ncbi:MAG TPA: serine protease [Candidatus Paceibacterota bacterium]
MNVRSVHIVIAALIVAIALETFAIYDLANTVRSLARSQSQSGGVDFGQFSQINKRLKNLESGTVAQTKTTEALVAESAASQKSSQSQISALSQNLKKLSSTSASSAALSWRARTVKVLCVFDGFTQSGSGTLFASDGKAAVPIVLTNMHVVSDAGRFANSCTLVLTELGATYTVARPDLAAGPSGTDLAFIVIPNPSTKVRENTVSSDAVCSSKANIGEQIIILGYPSFGAASSVTVTEGIVSGYENGHYLASAKVEHGHSGGTAVLISKDCYLGPPTFVAEGQLESLARILDVRAAGLTP